MTRPFTTLIPDARNFYAQLAQNNTRDWFNENKSLYEDGLKKPSKALLDTLAPQLGEMLDQSVKTKLFRPHRDVRFSKDKTPYTLHLHMLWAPQGNGTQPVYFFGVAGTYVTAGAGLMAFDKTQLSQWRNWVSEREGDALQLRINDVLAQGATLREGELKRIPSPFDKDHPRGDLLRRKSLVLWKDIETDAENDLVGALLNAYKLFDPVMDDLRAFL